MLGAGRRRARRPRAGRQASPRSWPAIAPDARVNSLGAKLVQLTMPGVPDVYQGCELIGPVAGGPGQPPRRSTTSAAGGSWPRCGPAGGGGPGRGEAAGSPRRALQLRRDHPDWFTGGYTPLACEGPAAEHAVAFQRGEHAVTVVTRLPGGLRRRGGWADTVAAAARAALAGRPDRRQARRPAAVAVRADPRLPVALLIPEAEADRSGSRVRARDDHVQRLGPRRRPGRGGGRRSALSDDPGRRGPAAGWWSADVPGVAAGIDYGFMLDGGELLPDPRSPRQPFGVNGLSRTL